MSGRVDAVGRLGDLDPHRGDPTIRDDVPAGTLDRRVVAAVEGDPDVRSVLYSGGGDPPCGRRGETAGLLDERRCDTRMDEQLRHAGECPHRGGDDGCGGWGVRCEVGAEPAMKDLDVIEGSCDGRGRLCGPRHHHASERLIPADPDVLRPDRSRAGDEDSHVIGHAFAGVPRTSEKNPQRVWMSASLLRLDSL